MTSHNVSLAARIAAYSSWAATPDRTARTAPARDAFRKRFEDEVDPDRVLPEAERAIRAEYARRAHYLRLALKSANARRARKAARASRPRRPQLDTATQVSEVQMPAELSGAPSPLSLVMPSMSTSGSHAAHGQEAASA